MKSRWGIRIGAVAVIVVWFVVAGIGGPLVGKLSGVQKNDNASFLPKVAESTKVIDAVAKFSDRETVPFVIVLEREQPATPADAAPVQKFVTAVPTLPLDLPGHPTVGKYLAATPSPAIPSKDGKALLVTVALDSKSATEAVGDTTPLFATAEALRAEAAKVLQPQGFHTYLTGPGGLIADFVKAFAGIDGILLGVALVVVFVILLVVYRSPILPVAVLLSALCGLSAAVLAVYPLAKAGHIGLSGQSQGILFILVIGAATDYALLLVSRYREELHDDDSSWVAMKRAWHGSVQPIAASAATVVLGLLCLLLSQLGSTSGLGPVGAFGIIGSLLGALTFLPAVLLLFGRYIFWPFVPRVDHRHSEDTLGTRGIWGRVAGLVGDHPRRTWVSTVAVLLAAAAFVPTLKSQGIPQQDSFRTRVESVEGQKVLERHFPGGSGSPVQVVSPQAKASQVLEALRAQPGVSNPYAGQQPGAPVKAVSGMVLIQATLDQPADSPAAEKVVRRLRTDLDRVSRDVLVGGSTAVNLDVRDASSRDLKVIVPTILAVIFVVLCLLLRSLVAPLLLVFANVVSFTATIGISALVFNHLFRFAGSDPSIPLYGFVFLVALGIDYSIFLLTRVREESARRGTHQGVLVGLAVTGGVITSAGVVLAATFSALAVLPLVFLVQIAFIVAFGVLLDTLVVRSLLVPALSYDIGASIWWPGSLSRARHRGPLSDHEEGGYTGRHAG